MKTISIEELAKRGGLAMEEAKKRMQASKIKRLLSALDDVL